MDTLPCLFVCRYDEHSLPRQQDTVAESTVARESGYAEPQTVINTTATTNNSSDQSKQHRSEVFYCSHSLADGWQGDLLS